MRNIMIAAVFGAALAPATLAAQSFELRPRANPDLSMVIPGGNVVEFQMLAVTVPIA